MPATLTCAQCQHVSSFTAAFQVSERGILCPRCAMERQWPMQARNVILLNVCIIVTVLFVALLFTRTGSLVFLLLNCVLCIAVWCVALFYYLLIYAGLTY